MCALQKIITLFLAVLGSIYLVNGASSSHAIAARDYAALRTCLLSWGLTPDQIFGRDNPLDEEPYQELNWQWNTLYGTIAPLAYVEARHAADVSAAVRCSTRLGVRVVAKAGGHSYLKHGFGDADSLIIDLHLLNSVQVAVDGAGQGIATIGAGARQGKIAAELWDAGAWILPVGNCPTVGFAGYVLGGGYGPYSRWIGLGSDHLLEATMVDATGAVLIVNSFTNPDIFWALRGGGGGNFGIVTEMRLRLHRAPDQVIVAEAAWTWDEFPTWFKAWQAWLIARPPPHLIGTPRINGTTLSTIFYSMNGTQEELEEVVKMAFPPSSSPVAYSSFTFPEFVVYRSQGFWPSSAPEPLTNISQLVNLTRHNELGWKRVKSIIVDRPVTSDEDIEALYILFLDYVQHSSMFLEMYGGAISDFAPSDTAYVHRGEFLYGLQPRAFAEGGDEPLEVVQAMERFFEGTKAVWNHTASYQNYLDQELPDYLQRYYGTNLDRLMAVKREVDLFNVFHHSKSIPVSIH